MVPNLPTPNGASDDSMSLEDWLVVRDRQGGRYIESRELLTVQPTPLSYMPKSRPSMDEILDIIDILATQNQILDNYTDMPAVIQFKMVSLIGLDGQGREDFKEVAIAEKNRKTAEQTGRGGPFNRARDMEGSEVTVKG